MATSSPFDVIVVGGGTNGLVAAAYLAKRGARAVVVEARHKTGGAADTMAPWPEAPGFKVTTLSYVMSLMPGTIVRDLRLEHHGYRGIPVGPYFVPFPDGRYIIQSDDAKADHDEFAKFSKHDAEALERWEAWIGGLADVLGPLLMSTPPRMGSRSLGDLREQLRLAWRYRDLGIRGVADVTSLMTMSIVDILDRFFESEQVKTVMALNGLIGTWAGPHEPGAGYGMAHPALDRAPVFAAIPEHRDLTGGFELAHSGAYLEKAFEEARSGRPATALFSDGVMPTFHDPTMAPEGKHVVSLFTQWCPAEYADEPHPRRAGRVRQPGDRRLRRARTGVQRLGAPPAGDRAARDGTGVGADRGQHLPW